jgi:hypothetical protein
MAEQAIPEWAKAPAPAAPKLTPDQLAKVKSYAAETDTLLGLKPGTSLAQLWEESNFDPRAVSKANAEGIAQIIPATRKGLEKQLGRPLNAFNIDDALLMHRAVMKENMAMFGNQDDALRGYNGGIKRSRWNNPETRAYVPKITNRIGRVPGIDDMGGNASPLLVAASTDATPVPDWARDTNVPDWAKEPVTQAAATTSGYKPFAKVRKDIDEASLNKDADFIRASMMMYQLFERKPFEGTASAAAEYGKNGIAAFNYNLVDLAVIGNRVVSEGTQEQKEAFLYMLDTYENTNISWNGFKRGAWHAITDPTNLVGIGTLGVATAGKFLGRKAALEAVKTEVKQSLAKQIGTRIGESVARTGMVAGIDTAVAMAATDATKQGIEVSAGRRTEVDSLQVAKEGGKGFVFGLVGGTALDATVAKIYRTIKGQPEVSIPGTKAAPEVKADVTVDPQGAVKNTTEAPAAPPERTLPESVTTGPTSFKTTPINAPSVYHETSPISASRLIAEDLMNDSRGARQSQIFVADNQDIAIGIGGKGVRIEYDGKLVSGTENKKPLTGDIAGREYETNAIGNNAIRSVTVLSEEDLVFKPSMEARFLKEFDKTVNPDGSITYTRKGAEPPSAPLGSTLTPAEIAAATARKQEGRLPEDAVAPDMSVPPATKVTVDPLNTGLRSTPMSMEELSSLGAKVADQIRVVSDADMPKVLEVLRTADDLTFEQTRVAARGIQMYADELRIMKAELVKKIDKLDGKLGTESLKAELEALEKRLVPLELADDAYGSMAGSILRQRQEGLPGVQGITVESIMADKGISKAEADVVWADLVGKAQQSAEVKKVEAAYEAKAQEALNAGDLSKVAEIAAQKNIEVAGMGEKIVGGSASWTAKLTEAAISNVFSLKTVMINLIPSGIKTLVIPALKFVAANPMEKAARIELVAAYSAMRSGFAGALQAAKAGYKYEQALLTRDGTRLLEEQLAIKGRIGGAIRFFPRILNASDEFLSRLNYDSFVASRSAAEALIAGEAKGLKGKDLNTFIKDATKKALTDSKTIENSTELVQPIINKGVNLGLTGDDLFRYIETEAVKNPQALLKGTDEEALNFVRDVLYKRQFSGEGNASKAAQAYEETMRKFPSAKLLLGQLFFRTPIRVFEEGVRLTPGLQLIAPNFISDLAGKNGTLKQVRAQSEAMTSLAVAGAVLSLYAQGRITGDGAYSDWKQQRNRTDGPLPEPYTIKMSDGSTWTYRGFDPLATPVKIMINGLERLDRLHIREAQGEFVNKTEFDAAQAYVTVGTTAIAAAIRDANLVAGINTTISLAENLSDPERKEDAWLKYLGEKLFLVVPNTLHKVARDNDPTIKDPATFWQVVDQKLALPFAQDGKLAKTAFSYDVLGNPRRSSDTGALWNVFSTATPEERTKGLSSEAQIVLTELDRLAKVTGATFKPPMKHPDLGDLDLRTVVASDGKRTLYDVWQDNYRNLKPEVPLAALAQSALPDGTFKQKAAKVEEMQQVIKEFQDAAFALTMRQEEKVMKRVIDQTLYEAKAKAGLFDLNRP